MKKIILILTIILSLQSFSFNNRNQIYEKIISKYENSNFDFYINNDSLKIKNKRSETIIKFDVAQEIEKINIKHKIKSEKLDKASLDELFYILSDIIFDENLKNLELSKENQEKYQLSGNIKLSPNGFFTKVVDVLFFSVKRGIFDNRFREKDLKIEISKR